MNELPKTIVVMFIDKIMNGYNVFYFSVFWISVVCGVKYVKFIGIYLAISVPLQKSTVFCDFGIGRKWILFFVVVGCYLKVADFIFKSSDKLIEVDTDTSKILY